MNVQKAHQAHIAVAYARRCASVGRLLARNFDDRDWTIVMTSTAVQIESKANAVSRYCHNDKIWFSEVAPGLFEITRLGL